MQENIKLGLKFIIHNDDKLFVWWYSKENTKTPDKIFNIKWNYWTNVGNLWSQSPQYQSISKIDVEAFDATVINKS